MASSLSPMSSVARLKLYALGSNGNGQLGLGHKDDVDHAEQCRFLDKTSATVTNVPLNDDEGIIKIVAGGNHSLLLTSKGRLWTTGSTLEGQRGRNIVHASENGGDSQQLVEEWREFVLEDQIEHSTPSGLAITDVAATFSASFIVVGGQHVYSFGTGTKGELGLGKDITSSSNPQLCFDLSSPNSYAGQEDNGNISSISACMSHVVILSSTGKLFGWGASRKGQLGEPLKDAKTVWNSCELDIGSRPEAVASQVLTGRDFTLVTMQGSDRKSQILLGDAAKIGITLPLSRSGPSVGRENAGSEAGSGEMGLEDIQDIRAGWTTITALTKEGTVYTFGNNRRSVVSAPIHNVRSIAVGSEHCVGLTEHGEVIAWGWGEHGNCGSNFDDDKNIRDRFNVIFRPSLVQKVLGIAAGCATTFFWITDIPA